MGNQFYPLHRNGGASSQSHSSPSSASPARSPGNVRSSQRFNGVEEEVFLPPSVEAKLQKICSKQSQEPADADARKGLASIGEQASLDLLEKISTSTIRKTLSAFIMFMVRKYHTEQNSSAESFTYSYHNQQNSTAESTFSSPQRCYSSPSSCSSSNCLKEMILSLRPMLMRTPESTMSKPEIVTPPSSHHPRRLGFKERANAQEASYQLSALSELEFRKFFLILNYIGRNNLEDVVTPAAADDIVNEGNQSMASFESYMWSKYGHFCEDHERLRYTDWDSGRTHLYYCNIDSNEEYRFKGPYLNAARTHLQQSLGDDNILIVRFSEDAPTNARKLIENGILVGLRRYRFFVFKDEEKRKSSKEWNIKCYFVRMETLGKAKEDFCLHGRKVHDARCLFMHAHMVPSMAKYMARFSLLLSKTVKLPIDLGDVKISVIDDIYCRDEDGSILRDEDGTPLIQTDGTGFISEDLAKKCPPNFYKRLTNGGKFREAEYQNMELPLIMQCRLYHEGRAAKGTLLVNRKLPESTIQFRRSMIKVDADPNLSCTLNFNSLEIVRTSHKPKRTHLSKYLIALLSYGGVPRNYFLDILKNALEEAQRIYSDEYLALKAASNYEDFDYGSIAKSMILSGVPLSEPYLQWSLSLLTKEEKVGLKGGKLPISDSFYLIGTADPTGVLNRDEICVILDYGQIVGEVLVYRHPGLHFGDIHKLNAVHVKELEEIVGNAKYAIFFSTKGQRSVANEIANGDFDGDIYWVSINRQLIDTFSESSPWKRSYSTPKTLSKKPNEFSAEELEHKLFQMFLETKTPSYNMSTAADSWLALMDRLLVLGGNDANEMKNLKEKMLQLIDLYYDALDAPKSGKKVNIPKYLKVEKLPHFMGKGQYPYQSTSVLGEIYDTVESYETKKPLPVDIKKLPCFDIKVPDECLRFWRMKYNEYRFEMAETLKSGGELKNDLANEVIKKYKQLLYGAEELEDSAEKMKDIYDNALAIYHVTYDFAKLKSEVGKCGFAWKVASSALCKLHAELQAKESNGKAMIVSPAILQKILHLRV